MCRDDGVAWRLLFELQLQLCVREVQLREVLTAVWLLEDLVTWASGTLTCGLTLILSSLQMRTAPFCFGTSTRWCSRWTLPRWRGDLLQVQKLVLAFHCMSERVRDRSGPVHSELRVLFEVEMRLVSSDSPCGGAKEVRELVEKWRESEVRAHKWQWGSQTVWFTDGRRAPSPSEIWGTREAVACVSRGTGPLRPTGRASDKLGVELPDRASGERVASRLHWTQLGPWHRCQRPLRSEVHWWKLELESSCRSVARYTRDVVETVDFDGGFTIGVRGLDWNYQFDFPLTPLELQLLFPDAYWAGRWFLSQTTILLRNATVVALHRLIRAILANRTSSAETVARNMCRALAGRIAFA